MPSSSIARGYSAIRIIETDRHGQVTVDARQLGE